jgi:hypothetical protein
VWGAVSLDGVGLSIQRRMAASGLSPEAFQLVAALRVARALGLSAAALSARARRALAGLAPVLDLVPGLRGLPERDRAALRALVTLKAARSENGFARALARAELLARAIGKNARPPSVPR